MSRSHRRRSRGRIAVLTLVLIVAAGLAAWQHFRSPPAVSVASASVNPNSPAPDDAESPPPSLTRARPEPEVVADEVLAPTGPSAPPQLPPMASEPSLRKLEEPAAAEAASDSATRSEDNEEANSALAAARAQLEEGRLIEARAGLNALYTAGPPAADAEEIRGLLRRIADETVFTRKIATDDPLFDTYVVQPGDVLVRIGTRCHVPAEGLMRINGIADANALRPNQKLKLPRGPFHARIDKSEFRLEVFLQGVFVAAFPVGLGADNGTPEGTWRVKERLPNPTYFPPESATDKRIIPPDDPRNPLGEHWIGLEGIESDTVGRVGYGIHGTIEPDSIGKAVSMGCIRMHNADVAVVYSLLQPGQSTVTVVP